MKITDMINLDFSRECTQTFEKVSNKDIAVIGICSKLPLADTAEEFWERLKEGTNCIRDIPKERKQDTDAYMHYIGSTGETMQYERAAYLDDIDRFDNSYFNISPREASLMDPNQRLFLEVVWGALEDAGYGGNKLRGSKTGVYMGFSSDAEYRKIISDTQPDMLSISITGNISPIITGRISYLLDLKGPSILVNTTCSSSLVAVHLACRAIQNGECEMAIVGGEQIYLIPVRQIKIGIEASDNTTRTFDDSSDGTGGGEGVVALLLKPLNKAYKDRDNIYAVIKGSAVNQDGASIGVSAPNPAAQEEVIISAWKDARINPEDVSYIETHGTGTRLGDPIEVEGIQGAFRRYTERKQFCAVGSVKTNIGHLDACAGIAGLLKAVLALKHRELPPLIHFNRPNRNIKFHKSPVYINNELSKWEAPSGVRRCGVSSFGFSGTNCHVVLEEAPQIHSDSVRISDGLEVLAFSTKTMDGMKVLLEKYLYFLDSNPEIKLEDICYTANTGRGHYEYRAALVIKSHQELREKLGCLFEEGIENSKLSQFFYGYHKVVTALKEELDDFEKNREEINTLSKEASEKLTQYIQSGGKDLGLLKAICELYVGGADIHWDYLYMKKERFRVSIPTYPFERKRHWITIPQRRNTRGTDVKTHMFYRTRWKPESLPESEIYENDKAVLIFKDGKDIGNYLAERFREEGKTVIEVAMGDDFCETSRNFYTVSNKEDDYLRLFEAVKNTGVSKVFHLATITDENVTDNVQTLEERQKRGVWSLFYISRAIKKICNFSMDIILVAEYVHEVDSSERVILPENGALFGLGKCLSIENPNVRCRCIDIDEFTNTGCVLEEIKNMDIRYTVAYRQGERYAEEVEKCHIDRLGTDNIDIKSNGIYVITGGMGGLGLEIAKLLCLKKKVNLALINRSGMPPEDKWDSILDEKSDDGVIYKINAVRKIKKSGSNVECIAADITDSGTLGRHLDMLRKKYGRINGVIHCAGVGVGREGRTLENIDEATFGEVMLPKVQGTWILDNATREDSLDFFIVFSSPITLTGGIGAGSYSAANYYLNSFVNSRNKQYGNTLAISWAPWENTMKKTGTVYDKSKHIFRTLSTQEITGAFETIFDKETTSLLVGRLNYESEIFHMHDLLAFKLSDEVKDDLRTYWERNAGAPIDESVFEAVEIKGRKDGRYDPYEVIAAKVFGGILGIKEISLYDNFYELGGDSIIALKAANYINKHKGLDIKVIDILKNPFILNFADFIREKAEKGRDGSKKSKIPTASLKDYYPLTPAQSRIYMLSQMKGVNLAYNMPETILIEGILNIKALENAFKKLVERHDSLRTSFEIVRGQPMQKIHREIPFSVDYKEAEEEEESEKLLAEFIKPFDLSRVPLIRVLLIKCSAQKHILAIDMHHIISDGVSKNILMKEFSELYMGMELPDLRIQYRDYADWVCLQSSGEDADAYERKKQNENYWVEVLSGKLPVLNIPTDYPRPQTQTFEGSENIFETGDILTGKLRNYVKERGTTLYTLLLACYYILLSKYTGQEDIIVGSVVAGRPHKDLERVVGIFLNFVPLRCYPKGNLKVSDFLETVRKTIFDAYENQDYPIEEIISRVNASVEPGRRPLYDTMFIMQNTGASLVQIDGLKFTSIRLKNNTSKLDLWLEAEETEKTLMFSLEYSTRLFKAETMKMLIRDYLQVIETIVNDKNIKINDIVLENKINTLKKATIEVDFDF